LGNPCRGGKPKVRGRTSFEEKGVFWKRRNREKEKRASRNPRNSSGKPDGELGGGSRPFPNACPKNGFASEGKN